MTRRSALDALWTLQSLGAADPLAAGGLDELGAVDALGRAARSGRLAGPMSAGSDISYAIGAAGVAVGAIGVALTIAAHRRERRLTRPVVVCHEVRKRHFIDDSIARGQAASVYLTNESAARAFNIRFGIYIRDVPVGWRHDKADEKPSRINALPPEGRWPEQGSVEVVIPDNVIMSGPLDRDPDEARNYWAIYQDPSGKWWGTSNPASRSEDLIVKRTMRRRFWSQHDRRLAVSLTHGEEVWRKALRELREATGNESPAESKASADE